MVATDDQMQFQHGVIIFSFILRSKERNDEDVCQNFSHASMT